jgi:hypothetical protein
MITGVAKRPKWRGPRMAQSLRIPRISLRVDQALSKVANRYGRAAAERWATTLARYKSRINETALLTALHTGSYAQIQAAVDATALSKAIQTGMQQPIGAAVHGGGLVATGAMKKAGLAFSFNAVHPNVILYAHTRSAALVTDIAEDTRAMIRTVVGLGAQGLATVDEQARLIRGLVGLPRHYVLAPLRLGDELRRGAYGAALGRGLPGQDLRRIRSAMRRGLPLDPTVIGDMQERYSQRLINLRAMTIARTETMAAANFGVNEAWRQAQTEGLLPKDARRVWINTPDSRICPICARIPGLNPEGRLVDEPFFTPLGKILNPPAHVSCRCTTGLVFSKRPGVAGTMPAVPSAGTVPGFPTGAPVLPPEVPGVPMLPPELAAPMDFSGLSDTEILNLGSDAFTPIRVASNDTFERYALAKHDWGVADFDVKRTQLHQAIVRRVFGDIQPLAEGEQATGTVLGGGAASGKSTVFPTPARTVKIDVDEIRKLLPEYKEGVAAGIKDISALTHEESSYIKDLCLDRAIAENYNFLLDGTGDSDYAHLAKKLARYKAAGHRLVGQYVTVDTDPAWIRQVIRANKSGRHVPEDVFREVHGAVSEVLPRAMNDGLFDEVILWDNNAGEGQHHILAHVYDHERVIVKDELGWQRFLAKKVEQNELIIHARNGIVGASEDPRLITNYLGAYGKEWQLGELPPDVSLMEAKHCYENASKLVMSHPDWRYCEGIAYTPKLPNVPFLHAWVVTPEGTVIDPTWGHIPGARYFGVPYNRWTYVRRLYSGEARYYGLLGGDQATAAKVIREGGLLHDGIQVREDLVYKATAPKPEPPPPAHPWLAEARTPPPGHGYVGSVAEGAEFSQSSVVPTEVYRISAAKNGERIAANGLRAGTGHWGDGVYFQGTKEIPATASGHLHDGVLVKARIDVQHLISYPSYDGDAYLSDLLDRHGWYAEAKAMPGGASNANMTKLLKSKGFDGIRILRTIDPTTHDWVPSANDWFIVFDPKQTMVTGVGAGSEATVETVLERQALADRLDQLIQSAATPLSPAEVEALDYYATRGYREINPTLRTGSVPDTSNATEIRKYIRTLDNAIEKLPPLDQAGVFWRGSIAPAQVGEEFIDKGFVSTTSEIGRSTGFARRAKNTLLRITTKPGQRGAWMAASSRGNFEKEFVLPRNTRFRVTGQRTYTPAQWFKAFPHTRFPGEGVRITVVDLEVV